MNIMYICLTIIMTKTTLFRISQYRNLCTFDSCHNMIIFIGVSLPNGNILFVFRYRNNNISLYKKINLSPIQKKTLTIWEYISPKL